MTKLLTIILNWRTPEMTLRAAEAALLALEGVAGALTIVDNASGDGSFETLTAAVAARGWDQGPQQVRVLQAGRNGGFGAGNNFGILAGLPGESGGEGVSVSESGDRRPDYVYLLNSDAFPEPGAIKALLNHLEAHPATGFAGSAIHGEDGVPHQTAFRFPSALGEFEGQIRFGPISKLLRNHVVALPVPRQTSQVDWLAGASLMMRMTVLEQIGLFDETFFLYFEETDLCRRAALAGWPTTYVVESRVMHIGSVSTGMKQWARTPGFWLDSRLHYFSKNHGRLGLWRATLAAGLGGALWRLRLVLQKKPPQDPPHFLKDMLAHHLRLGLRPRPQSQASQISVPAVQGPKA